MEFYKCDQYLLEKWNLDRCVLRLIEQKSLKSSVVGIMGKDSWKDEKDTQRRLYPMFCVQNALHSLNTKEPYEVNVEMPLDKLKNVLKQHRRRKSNLKEEELSQNGVKLFYQFWSASLLLRLLGQCIIMRMVSDDLVSSLLASQSLKFVSFFHPRCYFYSNNSLPVASSPLLCLPHCERVIKRKQLKIDRLLLFLNSRSGFPSPSHQVCLLCTTKKACCDLSVANFLFSCPAPSLHATSVQP